MSSAVGGRSDADDSEAIVDNVPARRFEAVIDGKRAELIYRVDGDRLTIVHTGVPESLKHGGLGGRLVAAALQKAVDNGYTIVPDCPFAAWWLEQHPEESRRVPIDAPSGRT
jgi:predicted GNAT family acetyltransferase